MLLGPARLRALDCLPKAREVGLGQDHQRRGTDRIQMRGRLVGDHEASRREQQPPGGDAPPLAAGDPLHGAIRSTQVRQRRDVPRAPRS